MTGLPLHMRIMLASIPEVSCMYVNLKILLGSIDSLNNLVLWTVKMSLGLRGLCVHSPVVLKG